MPGFIWSTLTAQTEELIYTLRQSVVLVQGSDGHGAGVVWDREGLIVTNDHVVRADRAAVTLAGGRQLEAFAVARDRENDLALLRVAASDLPAVPVGDSRSLQVGELVIAVGHPLGVVGAATLGIVSATGPQTWMGRSWMGQGQREWVQADVALAPGNSGGALANAQGEVIGIPSMILSPGVALAVPAHVVQAFAESYQRRGLQAPRRYKQAV